ncbi:hypothetical protein F4780DRAFT_782018 [Xylariomycetidae sp. FL0641]|nr:hypothetical protein F4780DRAFT_782018 [Xylariomycetidae sp. FL0641]
MRDLEFEATRIVRTYSDTIAEHDALENPLARVLKDWGKEEGDREAEILAWQQWLRFDRPSSDLSAVELEKQCKEVADAWASFKFRVTEEQESDGPPSIESLYQAVQLAQSKWETKKAHGFGKAKDRITSFLGTMDGYRALFSVIPTGDKYLSLFTGVVSSIVHASSNHATVGEGLASALADISSDMRFVGKSTKISNSATVRRDVVRLYVEIFNFLCYAMNWYSSRWNRLKRSLDSKFYDEKVVKKVTDIKKLVKEVSREAKLETQSRTERIEAQNSKIEKEVSDIKDGMKYLTNELLKRNGDETRSLPPERQIELFQQCSSQLLQLKQQLVYELETITIHSLLEKQSYPLLQFTTNTGEQHPVLNHPEQEDLMVHTRDGLEAVWAGGSRYGEDAKDELLPYLSQTGRPLLPGDVLIGIQSWLGAAESKFVWIEGPAFSSVSSELSPMMLRLALGIMDGGIPTISFFAKRRYSFQPPTDGSQQAGMIAMTYTLIDQLIRLTPASFSAVPELSEKQLKRLDGSFASYSVALDTIAALLGLIPTSMVCIIDALDTMDSRDTASELVKLINILREHGKRSRLKVLFSTSGNCRALNETISVREQLSAERMAIASRGSPLPGGADISAVRIQRTPRENVEEEESEDSG